jgi:hypothetical protein
MNILFFLHAGNGDLINFTGPLGALKAEYPEVNIDFLVTKKHSYILEGNPNVRTILHLDDYPVPKYCKDAGHSEVIKSHFQSQYDRIINAWAVEHFSKHKMTERNADFITLSMKTLGANGFPLKSSRKSCAAQFFYNDDDRKQVDGFVELNRNAIGTKKIVLMEANSFSWKSPEQPNVYNRLATLNKFGYITAGNGDKFDLDISVLNLKQTKLFFDKYCSGFYGLSSGMTCSIYARSTNFAEKNIVINGLYPSWNLVENFEKAPRRYLFTRAALSDEDLKSVFLE